MKELQLVKGKEYRACFLGIDGVNETTVESVHPAIIFVTETTLSIRFSSDEKRIIPEGQFFLLPRNFVCHFSSEEYQKLIMLVIPDMTDLYTHFFFHLPHKELNSFQELFYPLPMHWPIRSFIRGLALYLQDETINSQLAGIKVLEFFHLIRYSFSKELLVRFLLLFFRKNMNLPCLFLPIIIV